MGRNDCNIRILLGGVLACLIIMLIHLKSQGYESHPNVEDSRAELSLSESSMYPTDGRIVVAASTPIPPTRPLTRKAYEDIVDCGFNMFFQDASIAKCDTVFRLIKGLDLKMMVNSYEINKRGNADYLRRFVFHPQFAGWKFKDEPRYDDLKKLKRYYNVVREICPKYLAYINLVGDNMRQFTGDSPDYASYLDTIDHYFSPTVWSYDFYPISIKNGIVKVSDDLFYSNLEVVSRKSKATKRPFWVYCQSMEFKNKAVARPAATAAFLRYEAFSALAYGAQGIVYWTYAQRVDGAEEHYLSALVNLDGSKTGAWYDARRVNREIKALNNVFYKSELVECRHTGDKLNKDTKKMTQSIGPLRRIISGSSGVLVSHLKTNGDNYIVVVSHDPLKSQKVRLQFDEKIEVVELLPDISKHSESVKTKNIKGNVVKQLSAGGYAVYKW